MNESFYTELLELKVQGKLNPEQEALLTSLIPQGSYLSSELKAYHLAKQAIEIDISNGLKSKFNEWDQKKKSRLFRVDFKTISIAASLFLFLSVCSILWHSNQHFSNRSIVNDHLHKFNTEIRGVNSGPETLSDRIGKLRDGLEQNPTLVIQETQALLKLSVAGVQKDAIEWTLALAYLENNQNEKALTLLKSINANPDHSYQKHSKAVLDKLNSNWRVFLF